MPKEIELKFLLNKNEELKGKLLNKYSIQQGYLSSGKNHVTRVRLRTAILSDTTEGFLTIKSTGAGISRDEFEYEIPLSDAQAMINDAESSLSKTRDVLLIDGLHFEVDHFSGSLSGLAFVEIEFSSEKEALSFDPTKYSFLGKDVSNDKAYSNYDLSLREYNRTINVKDDFSSCPFGRYLSDGGNSGERFREDFLVPELNSSSSHTFFNFEGLEERLSSGFLDESFAGLVRNHNFHPLEIFSKLSFINIEMDILDDILEYVLDMSDFSIINKNKLSSKKPSSKKTFRTTVNFNVEGHEESLSVMDSDISDSEIYIKLIAFVYKKYGLVNRIEIENIIR